jgi:hypothetical protein
MHITTTMMIDMPQNHHTDALHPTKDNHWKCHWFNTAITSLLPATLKPGNQAAMMKDADTGTLAMNATTSSPCY